MYLIHLFVALYHLFVYCDNELCMFVTIEQLNIFIGEVFVFLLVLVQLRVMGVSGKSAK